MEQTVDDVVIIAAGRLLRDASLAELTSGARTLRIRTTGVVELTEVLERVGAGVQRLGDDRLLLTGVTAEKIAELAFSAGATLTELTEHKPGLEEIFLELTTDKRTWRASRADSPPDPTVKERQWPV